MQRTAGDRRERPPPLHSSRSSSARAGQATSRYTPTDELRRRSASHRSKWLPLLLWLGTFAGVLLLAGSSLGAEPASQTFTSCDGAAAPAAVMAEFDVSAGSDLSGTFRAWHHPRDKRPERSAPQRPASRPCDPRPSLQPTGIRAAGARWHRSQGWESDPGDPPRRRPLGVRLRRLQHVRTIGLAIPPESRQPLSLPRSAANRAALDLPDSKGVPKGPRFGRGRKPPPSSSDLDAADTSLFGARGWISSA